jgi:2-polyprenyl-6-methoxyphenol hydroxylase-like FAD-dependent oxidoreductase
MSHNSTAANQNGEMSTQLPVIIIGAGVSGLTLAQACQKKNIPFRIFERDDSASLSQRRVEGKGLTECWPLNVLKDALPDELAMHLSECHASRGALSFGEEDHYDTFNLETAEPTREKSTRIRLSQEKFRKLLLTGIEVQCSKTLTEISVVDGLVEATFSDGTSETGSILIGCDGNDSTVRRIMHPQGHPKPQLRHLLATTNYPASEVSAIRNLHPFFLRCTQPGTDILLLITFFEHTSEDSHADDTTKSQLLLQWPYRSNWLGRVDPTDCPNTKIGQRALLKHLSDSWAEPFRSFIQNMPRDTDIRPADFSDGHIGYSASLGAGVTLAGSAANLAPQLDEGAESSSRSVRLLLEALEKMYAASGDFDWEAYEDTLREKAGSDL